MPPKSKQKYSLKKVRATEAGWDGFHLRGEDDVFVIRVYDGIEPAKWYEILGDANTIEATQLETLLADPMLAVPETQRPPDEKKRPAAAPAPAAVAAYDGSVL